MASQRKLNKSLVLLDKNGNEVSFDKRSKYKNLWLAIKSGSKIKSTGYKYSVTNVKRVLKALDTNVDIEKPVSKKDSQEWIILPYKNGKLINNPKKGFQYDILFWNRKIDLLIQPETYHGLLTPIKWSKTFEQNFNRFLSNAKGKQFIIYVDKNNKLSLPSKDKMLQVWKITKDEAIPLTVAPFKLTAMELVKQEAAANILTVDNSTFEMNKLLKDKDWDKAQLNIKVSGNTISELFNKLSIDKLPVLKEGYEVYILEARLILRLEDGKVVSHASVASESPARLKLQLVRELVQDIRQMGYTFTKVTTIDKMIDKAKNNADYDAVQSLNTTRAIIEERFEIFDRNVTLSANLYKYNSVTGEASDV